MNEHTYSDALIKAHETGDLSYLKEFEKEMDRQKAELESQSSPQAATKKNAVGVYATKKKVLRGKGRVYLRGSTWWISYSKRGHEFRESAHSTDESKAQKFLNRRLEEREKPTFVGPKEEHLTLDDLEAKILADYRKNNLRSAKTVTCCLKKVKEYFAFYRLVDITTSGIDDYQKARLDEKAAKATVNREMAYLRHGFKLLIKGKQISQAPVIELIKGENIRQGFINKGDFDTVVTNLHQSVHPAVKDILIFLYHSGWRSGEAWTLEWQDVDLDAQMIRLRRENSKNKEPRMLPLLGELKDVIERRANDQRMDCPYVFHRNGKQIRSFLRAWKTACEAIGQPNLVPHDMRRSAVRNFRKAGLSENEGMKMSGHKTTGIYRRYDIIDEEDMKESMGKVQKFLEGQPQGSKVIPIRKTG